MKFVFFIIIVLPLFLKAQSSGPDHTPTLVASEFNPNDLIIDQIECVGNETTSCDLIQKEVYLSPGDKINEDELSNAKIRLQLKSLFKSVDLYLKKGSARGRVNVVVEVQEGDPTFTETEFATITGSGYSSSVLRYTYGHRNLFGTGKVLQASVNGNQYDDTRSYSGSISYTDPHLLGSKRLFFNLQLTKSITPERTNGGSTCDGCTISSGSESSAYEASVGYRIFDFSYLSLGLVIQENNDFYRTADGSKNYLKSGNKGLSVNYGWNSEDDSYFPTSGSKLNLGITKFSRDPGENGSYYLFSEFYNSNFNFRKNWSSDSRNIFYIQTDVYGYHEQGASDAQFLSDNKLGYARQASFLENGETRRSRWFFQLNPTNNVWGASTGFLFEYRRFGVIKLSLSKWGEQ